LRDPHTDSFLRPLVYIFAVNDSRGEPWDGADSDSASTWQLQQVDLPWRLQRIADGRSWPEWDHPAYQDFIPIICFAEETDGESDWICLRVRGEDQYAVTVPGYNPFTSTEGMAPVAETFAEFLSDLTGPDNTMHTFQIRRRLFEA